MTRKLLTALALLLIMVSCQVTTEESSSNNGENNVIASFAPLATQTVPNGTTEQEIKNKLPKSLTATIDGKENQIINGVTWELNGTYTQKKETQTITFTAKLPDGYKLASGVVAPTITVTVNAPIPEDGQYGPLTIENGVVTKCDKSATTIKIPDGVTSIGNMAFANCSGLTSVTIPNSVTSIGEGAFADCDNIETVTYTGTLAQWCIWNNDPSLIYSAKLIKLSDVPNLKELTKLTIPNGVTSIEYSAFANCSSLTSVIIPSSVAYIGDYAFCDCSKLTSVTIEDGVISIGYSAFRSCSSLTSVTIPNSVTSIEESAFSYCSNLASVTIPGSVTSIGYSAFRECSSLTSVTIPNSVTSIGSSAFENCSNLETINYGGTKAQWEEINIDSYSDLYGITITGSDGTSWVCE